MDARPGGRMMIPMIPTVNDRRDQWVPNRGHRLFFPRNVRKPTEQNPNQQNATVYLKPPCQSSRNNRNRRTRGPGDAAIAYSSEESRPSHGRESIRVWEKWCQLEERDRDFGSEDFNDADDRRDGPSGAGEREVSMVSGGYWWTRWRGRGGEEIASVETEKASAGLGFGYRESTATARERAARGRRSTGDRGAGAEEYGGHLSRRGSHRIDGGWWWTGGGGGGVVVDGGGLVVDRSVVEWWWTGVVVVDRSVVDWWSGGGPVVVDRCPVR
ncbi:hypothetical protein Vadar_023133 [Vaccinium darrowii]|uniref:Uncharacterized protein n=1 Tax=Vaccinium darrowii TaxID=229202 RepID=A0ACB7XBT8_9ERIC|nr:hypothetical protein Vadar_023133 [Vaccinium darrowii]